MIALREYLVAGGKFTHLLKSLVAKCRVNKGEVIRKSVAVYAFLISEIESGNRVVIVNSEGETVKELALLD